MRTAAVTCGLSLKKCVHLRLLPKKFNGYTDVVVTILRLWLTPFTVSYRKTSNFDICFSKFICLFCRIKNEIGFSLFNELQQSELRKSKNYGSSHPEVFLGKGFLKLCRKFTGEHPCRSVISKKLQSSFIEVALPHGCSPVNLLHIFRTPFSKNTSGRLLLKLVGIHNEI